MQTDGQKAHPFSPHPQSALACEATPTPTPRLAQVIAAAYDTYHQTVDAALRELLTEVLIAMGVDQDTRVEISTEEALQVMEALKYIREA